MPPLQKILLITTLTVLLPIAGVGCSRPSRGSDEVTRFSKVTPSQDELHKLRIEELKGLIDCVATKGFEMPGDINEGPAAGPFENLETGLRAKKGFGITGSKSYVTRITASKSSGRRYRAALNSCVISNKSRLAQVGEILDDLGPEMAVVRETALRSTKYRAFSLKYEACMSSEGFPGVGDSQAAFSQAVASVEAASNPEDRLSAELPIAEADLRCGKTYGALADSAFDAAGGKFMKAHRAQLSTLLSIREQVHSQK